MAGKFQITYRFNDFMYNIIESEEVHKLLDDGDYFVQYISEHSNSIEMFSGPSLQTVQTGAENLSEKGNTKAENAKAVTWDSKATKLLLSEYLERKDSFRDPKIKKKGLWTQICDQFKGKGHLVTEDMLDKKFRNLKCHYKTIKDNNKKTKTGQGRITWEYFELMEAIFQEDKTINPDEVLSSLNMNAIQILSTNIQPLVQLHPSTSDHTDQDESQSTSLQMDIDNADESMETPTTKKKLKSVEGKKLYKYRQSMVEIENRRVLALEKIGTELEIYNKIQNERNQIMKKYLSSSREN